jgi:hypothetical protein
MRTISDTSALSDVIALAQACSYDARLSDVSIVGFDRACCGVRSRFQFYFGDGLRYQGCHKTGETIADRKTYACFRGCERVLIF